MLDPRIYWGRFRDVAIDRPIFLLGVQGGGLTLLSRMLRRHPEVVSVTGNHRYWSGADEMHTVFGPILPPELTGTRYKVPAAEHPLYNPPRSWTYACEELLPYYRKTAKDATPEIKRGLERVVRYCLRRYAPGRRARFIDKSQVYTVRVSLIRELLKEYNPRFVLVVNNPYAACYRAALGKAQDMERLKGKLSFQERLEICAQHWANSIHCALEDKADDMLIVRFEDLLREPEGTLRRICEHVELEFRKDMLPAPHHKVPFGSRFQDRWYPLNSRRALHYMEKATGKQIQSIEKYCGTIALRFHYSNPNKGEDKL
ncbi:sulfotransferase family protein [Thermodesulforhabdus norvegica]|nr:sulfotransferase [Thermodesulforhabdus norvegica]